MLNALSYGLDYNDKLTVPFDTSVCRQSKSVKDNLEIIKIALSLRDEFQLGGYLRSKIKKIALEPASAYSVLVYMY